MYFFLVYVRVCAYEMDMGFIVHPRKWKSAFNANFMRFPIISHKTPAYTTSLEYEIGFPFVKGQIKRN